MVPRWSNIINDVGYVALLVPLRSPATQKRFGQKTVYLYRSTGQQGASPCKPGARDRKRRKEATSAGYIPVTRGGPADDLRRPPRQSERAQHDRCAALSGRGPGRARPRPSACNTAVAYCLCFGTWRQDEKRQGPSARLKVSSHLKPCRFSILAASLFRPS